MKLDGAIFTGYTAGRLSNPAPHLSFDIKTTGFAAASGYDDLH
jgi:hypothetical protein